MGQKMSRLGDVFGSRNGNSSRNGGAAAGCASGGGGVGSCCCAAAVAYRQRRPSVDVGVPDAVGGARLPDAAGARLPDAVAAERCEASTSGADAVVVADCSQSSSKGPKKSHWKLRLNARFLTRNRVPPSLPESLPPPMPLEILPEEPSVSEVDFEPFICSVYRRTEDDLHSDDIGVNFDDVIEAEPLEDEEREETESMIACQQHNNDMAQFERAFQSFEHHSQLVLPSFDEGMMDLHSDFIGEQFMLDDAEDRAYKERAKEIQEGIEPPPGFRPGVHIQLLEFNLPKMNFNNLTTLFHRAAITALNAPQDLNDRVHTSIDYIHYLVPDLLQITNCSCYWGKMDRYEAEKLLDNRPEGTFLLRDSAQDEYLFSVSFRKYGRSLHARIEQWNHLFSFDSRDPGVFASNTVCGLVEHYKDPTCCMFFEPMLTLPLHRNFTFSLQHACRATICSMIGYDDVNQLKLPKCLKSYLKEYHYKQRVRVRVFDDNLTDMQSTNYT